jgi:hypothetical protein
MPKIYTVAQRLESVDGPLYVHAFGDAAFSKLSKCTTHKRGLGENLVNFSYRMADDEAAPIGEKVYTIQEKVTISGELFYVQAGEDVAYRTKKEAQRALKALRDALEGEDITLVLYSFKVDQPTVHEFTVSVQVAAGSQEEADALVNGWIRSHGQRAVAVAG